MMCCHPITVESKKRTAGKGHCNKTQFLCFSALQLRRHTRPAALLSSLGVINEHALRGRREERSNCYLYFGVISFCVQWAFPLQIRNTLDAKLINYGDIGFSPPKTILQEVEQSNWIMQNNKARKQKKQKELYIKAPWRRELDEMFYVPQLKHMNYTSNFDRCLPLRRQCHGR